jgi:chromosome segregation ATPase
VRRQVSTAEARHAAAVQAINGTVRSIEQECDVRIGKAGHLIASTLRRAFPQEIERLRHELEECERAEAQTEGERTQAMNEITRQRENLLRCRERCDERLQALALAAPAAGLGGSADQVP